MIALSAMIYMRWPFILLTGIILIAAHNLLDGIHVKGNGLSSFLWSVLHEPKSFSVGQGTINVLYPVLPWIGIMSVGYCIGVLYNRGFDPAKRKGIFLFLGVAAIILFVCLRSGNYYGDASHWSVQKNNTFSLLSFLNVTKYPPSFLYALITLGPALIFLAVSERPLNALTKRIALFGRVAMFYYLAHLLLIHLLAIVGALILGYQWSDMILTGRVNNMLQLKGYGFDLPIVYVAWVWMILLLYLPCKWFDKYKRKNLAKHSWLSYI
jgi:uncharacterized membrane protein